MQTAPVGRRIAAYRRRRGLSQAALAGLVGRSESWLSQVERGLRSVDRLSVLVDLAKVLHVEVNALTGQPSSVSPLTAVPADGLSEIRRAFTSYGHLLAQAEAPVPSATELRSDLARAHAAYQAARYGEVIVALPALLDGADQTRGNSEPNLPYVSAYILAAKLMTKLGVTDLAMLAADRASGAATISDSPAAVGLSSYQVACALLRAEQPDDAELLAVGMAEKLQGGANDPATISTVGALWLIASVIAARKVDRSTAWDRLDRAEGLAWMLGEDGNWLWTAFGPTNVLLHRVSVAAELGDAGEALRVAQDVDEDRLPRELLSRRAQIQLDLAWALCQRRKDADATLHLLEAERVAPEALRHNVRAQEMIREMLGRGSRSKTQVLVEIAKRAGLLE